MSRTRIQARLVRAAVFLGAVGTLLSAAPASALYQAGERWPNDEVKVCWRSDAVTSPGIDFPRLSTIIREAVENSWGKAAHLRFVDWGTCSGPAKNQPKGWVVIHWKGQDPGESSSPFPAWSDFGYSSSRRTAMWYWAEAPEVDLQTYAIHEFGHALGFGHEGNHPRKGNLDPNCPGTPATGATALTPYDARSIMGCGGSRVLSDWDVVGVQSLYGRKRAGTLVGLANRVLDLPGSSRVTGIPLQVFNYFGRDNQLWSRADQAGKLRVLVGRRELCAAVPPGPLPPDAGTLLESRVCDTSPGQSFDFQDVQIHAIGNKCLDVPGGSYFAGQSVQIYDCHPGANQKWTVETSGRIRAGRSGLCLDVPDGTAVSGKLLQLYPCHDGPGQRFTFRPNGEIRFGSLCLDSQFGDPVNGRRIQLFNCKRASNWSKRNQQFHLTGPVHGSGQCLDIRGGVAADRAAAQVFPCHGGPNQVWDYYVK